MAANSNLLISITAKDQASGTFRRIKVSLGELEKESGDAGDAIGDLGKIFSSGLGKVAGGIAGFFAVGQLAQTAVELGKIGAQSERTRAAYGDLAAAAGVSAQSMLQAMRQATAGTVADSELMLNANRAMMLGVADSAEEMARLMAAAIERGRALGVSSAQAVNDIITGIGRMSPMILDNLGITGAAQAFDKYAESLGKTADQLSDVEKKQALVNAVLSQSSVGPVANDAAAAFERMDASLQNAKEALGVLFSPAIAAIADRLAEAVTGATDALKIDGISSTENQLAEYQAQLDGILRQLAALERVRETLATQPAFAPPELQSATPGDIDALRQQATAIAALIYQTQQQLAALRGISEQTARTRDEQLSYNQSLWQGQSAWAAFRTAAQISSDAVMAASQQIVAAAQGGLAQIAQSVAEVQGTDAGVAWLRGANAHLERQIELWANAGYSIGEITGVLLPQYISNLSKIIDNAHQAYTATASIAKGAQQAGTVGARMMAGLAIKIGQVERGAGLAANAIAKMASAAGAILAQRKFAGSGGLGAGFRSIDYVPIEKATDSATAFERALGDLLDTASTGGIGGGGIGGVSDAFDDLRSKIEGVIGEATRGDIGGLNPADFLPREDAINENARRLAAIMRDGIGNQEWLDEFKAEVPGIFDEIASSSDPRGAAARILQEFQQGLRPELLDKEQIKARVKAMLLGEQNTAALAQEIAAELSSELGMSLAQAQQAVAGVMGIGGGVQLPENAQAGPDGKPEAEKFVNAWTSVVVSMVEQFDASGRTVGTAFSAGFLSTQAAMIDSWAAALVGKMIPAVVAALAAQGSRTGAQ